MGGLEKPLFGLVRSKGGWPQKSQIEHPVRNGRSSVDFRQLSSIFRWLSPAFATPCPIIVSAIPPTIVQLLIINCRIRPQGDSFSDTPSQYSAAVFNNYSDEPHKSAFDVQQGSINWNSLAIFKALNSSNYSAYLNTPEAVYQYQLETPRSNTHSFGPALSSTWNDTAPSSGNSTLGSTTIPSSTNAESSICTCCKCTCKASHHYPNISPPHALGASIDFDKVGKRGASPNLSRRLSKSQCGSCNKEFTRSADLERHTLNIHQRLRWYCELGCDNNHGSGWCREDKRNEHIRRQHPEFRWKKSG